jgi:hypothetical protein
MKIIFPRRYWSKGLFQCITATVLAAVTGILLISVAAFSEETAGDHACDYLSKDEVESVMGVAVGEVERQAANPLGQSLCFFDIPAGMKLRFAQVQMVRSAWASHNWNARSLFENNMGYLSDKQEISGVGEKAYWGGSGMKLGAGLHVLQKDVYFTVDAASGDEQVNLQKAKELAARVLANIE